MITKGRKKSTNIVDRRSETKRTNKTNNKNNSAGLISVNGQKANGKANTFISSSPNNAGNIHPRAKPAKVEANYDMVGRGPKGKANRNTFRTGR